MWSHDQIMREVILTPNLYRFDQKSQFFEGRSWFKLNNFRLVLSMTLKIYSCVRKGLKLKVLQETSREHFCIHTAALPILNRAKS